MDQELVEHVAAAVKAGGRDVEGVVSQLFADHVAGDVVSALKQLSQEIQAQLSDRLAEWAEYRVQLRPADEYRETQAEYFSWKAAAARYREGINTALRAAKRLKHELTGGEDRADAGLAGLAAGYKVGARVMFSTDEGGDTGSVIEVQGRSVWVIWDKQPDLPVQYASPWQFSVIEAVGGGK